MSIFLINAPQMSTYEGNGAELQAMMNEPCHGMSIFLRLFGHLNEGDDKTPALSSARIQFVGDCFSRVAEASA